MNKDLTLNSLWLELTEVENIHTRLNIIYTDVQSGENRYKKLADIDPYRFFKLLGGNESDAVRYNCAHEFTYDDYIEEYDEVYDETEANEWDLEAKSIEKAHDSGHWMVTGVSILVGLKGDKLTFKHQYTEGYFDGIIQTPYNSDEDENQNKILFD